MLWQLTFYKTPDACRADGFDVGYFDTLDEVETVKAECAALPGFRDCPGGTWDVVGHAVDAPADGVVWRVTGYNWSEDGDERDLIDSPVFASKEVAEACLRELSARYQREHMEIAAIHVGRRWWTEGFDSGDK